MPNALTAKFVEKAKAEPAKRNPEKGVVRTEFPDGHTRGLFLVVQPSGAKSWVFRYRFGVNDEGKPKSCKLMIGPVITSRTYAVEGDIPLGQPHLLAEARTAAQAAKLMVARGIKPGSAKKNSAVPTDSERDLVETHAALFIKIYVTPKYRSPAETIRQFSTTILPVIGSKHIGEVTKADIVKIRDDLLEAGTPIMANRIFATLRKFFNWSVGRGALETTPCAGLSMPSAETSRDRVLSWHEVAALWATVDVLNEPFGSLVRMLLLTAQRRSEVGEMRDNEFDRDRMIWTVPASRAKNGITHILPVTGEIAALIDGVKRVGSDGFVFSTTGKSPVSGFSKMKARLDEALQFNSPWTLHDIRRTVATGMAELGHPPHVVEAILNHKSGTIKGVAAIYNRHDYFEEKSLAVEAWGRFLHDVISNDTARLSYSRLRDRRDFKKAIHSDEDTWRTFIEPMQRPVEKAAA